MKFEDYLIALSDVFHIFKRNRKYILAAALALAALASFYAMSRPVVHQTKANFREMGKQEGSLSPSVTQILLGGKKDVQSSQAISSMKSRKILAGVARSLGLQASMQEAGASRGLFGRMLDNIKIQCAYLLKKETVETRCPQCPLKLVQVDYDGKSTLPLSIDFTSSDTYLVKNRYGTIGEGKLGHPFRTDHFSFTLAPEKFQDYENRRFGMSLIPLGKMVDHLEASVNIEEDDNDASLLVLEYNHPNPEKGRLILDAIMQAYQNHLKAENDRFAETQLAYLKKRQEEMFASQTKVMEKHARILADDLSSSGFVNFEKEMEFLFKNRLGCLEKINKLEMLVERLQTLPEEPDGGGQILAHEELAPISPVLKQLTDLKMQRDSLTLALAQSPGDPIPANLSSQFSTLEDVSRTKDEITDIIAYVENDRPIPSDYAVTKKPFLLVGEWKEKLESSKTVWEKNSGELQKQKKAFLSYLNNLRRLFEMHQNLIHERLSHQTSDHAEFRGIDLDSASQLYLSYMQEAHRLESTQKEHEFILKQMEDADFEINSLSGALKDPISQNIIQKSSTLALQLRDQKYHSPKEQERTRNEMDSQKAFLEAHLQQTLKIQNLQQNLLQQKLKILQEVMLELIHEKISVLEKHINDFIRSQIQSLTKQKELIAASMNRVNQNMASLPDKWLSEQIIKQNVDLNKAIVEELTRLVEKKNISHNLELIQSAPLDPAYAATLPKNPRIILFALMGAVLGTLFSLSFFVVRQLFQGVEATPDNLKQLNRNVAGSLSPRSGPCPISDQDLETLRRQISFMEEHAPPKDSGRTALLTLGNGPNYSKALAKLLTKKGCRVLLLDVSFTEASPPEKSPGLLHCLSGAASAPQITSEDGIDFIHPGGISRYSSELVGSERFGSLLARFKQSYDWILLTTNALPASSEAVSMKPAADIAALTLSHETLADLAPYLNSKQPVVFMFDLQT
jgi:tyrosine-protein kinase Etk/Wzc